MPSIVVICFAVAGFRDTWYIKNGLFIKGWIFALIISLFYGLITNSRVILPHRHFEYFMIPISVLAVYGIRGIFLNLDYKKLFKKSKEFVKQKKAKITQIEKYDLAKKRHTIYIYAISILVLCNALSVYEVHRALGQSDETITFEDIVLLDWVAINIDKNSSIIISDHRLERMAEAFGFNTSMDEVVDIWSQPEKNITKYLPELFGLGKNYSRITHIIIDDIMIDNGVHVGYQSEGFVTVYMTDISYEKFYSEDQHIFTLLHRVESNETINDKSNIPIHWTEVYMVNWTYLENQFLIDYRYT